MGYERQHATIVTTFGKEYIELAHEKARSIFGPLVSNIVKSTSNGMVSFFVAPDGSKEGWPESDKGDENREEFRRWLIGSYDNGVYLDWTIVMYGDDEREARVDDHSGLWKGDEEMAEKRKAFFDGKSLT